MKSFLELENALQEKSNLGKITFAVPCPYEESILVALSEGTRKGFCKGVLVGDCKKIEETAKKSNIELTPFEIVEEKEDAVAIERSCELLENDAVSCLMKGLVHTGAFLKGILQRKNLLTSSLLTHVAVYEIPDRDLLFVSDPSIMVQPTIEQKKIIILNALHVMRQIGISHRRVAVLSSVEAPAPAVPSSVEAFEIVRDLRPSLSQEEYIEGPLALDNAFSLEAAALKGLSGPVAGKANLFIVPSLDAGNIFCKGLTYIGNFPSAGIVAGTRKPVVLTSRSAGKEERYHSMLLACLMA